MRAGLLFPIANVTLDKPIGIQKLKPKATTFFNTFFLILTPPFSYTLVDFITHP